MVFTSRPQHPIGCRQGPAAVHARWSAHPAAGSSRSVSVPSFAVAPGQGIPACLVHLGAFLNLLPNLLVLSLFSAPYPADALDMAAMLCTAGEGATPEAAATGGSALEQAHLAGELPHLCHQNGSSVPPHAHPPQHTDSLLLVPADGGFALAAISSSSAAGRQLHLWTAPAEGSSSVSPAGLWRQLPLWPHAAPTPAPSAATCTVSDMGAPAAVTSAGGASCFAVAFPRSDMSGQWLACAALEAASPGEQVYPPNVAWLPEAATAADEQTQQQRSRHSSNSMYAQLLSISQSLQPCVSAVLRHHHTPADPRAVVLRRLVQARYGCLSCSSRCCRRCRPHSCCSRVVCCSKTLS